MAKKVQTPEEYKAKMEKRVARRTLFFGTFTKSLAIFLAIALAFTLATIAYSPDAKPAVASSNSGNNGSSSNSSNGFDDNSGFDNSTPADTPADDQSSTPADDQSATPADPGNSSSSTTPSNNGGSSQSSSDSSSSNSGSSVSKAAAIKTLNDATARAAGAGYTWTRSCVYTKPISVGGATGILNGIIKAVDSNADLNSVVGDFLDITGDGAPLSAKVTKGGKTPEGMKDKFRLKGMTLNEGDVTQYQVTGNTYKFQVKDTKNPDKGSPLDHATNDYITLNEVSTSLADAIGDQIKAESLDVDYKTIVITAEINDGKLSKMQMTYIMDVNPLTIKAGISIKGTGAGKVDETYKDFVY